MQNEPIKIGPGQYACPFCNRVSAHSGSIKRHILIHTGEKPFKCKYCPMSCRQKSDLKNHIQNKHKISEADFESHSTNYM